MRLSARLEILTFFLKFQVLLGLRRIWSQVFGTDWGIFFVWVYANGSVSEYVWNIAVKISFERLGYKKRKRIVSRTPVDSCLWISRFFFFTVRIVIDPVQEAWFLSNPWKWRLFWRELYEYINSCKRIRKKTVWRCRIRRWCMKDGWQGMDGGRLGDHLFTCDILCSSLKCWPITRRSPKTMW